MFSWFSDTVLLPLLATAATAAIGFASVKFTQFSGIQIEAKHREALHSALMTGARMAVERLGAGASKTSLEAEAIRHAQQSVPDALSHFKPAVDTLEKLAASKLQEVLSNIQTLGGRQ